MTFYNLCRLKRDACEQGETYQVLHAGTCDGKIWTGCPHLRYGWEGGSGKMTYYNLCRLTRDACEQGETYQVLHVGTCDGKILTGCPHLGVVGRVRGRRKDDVLQYMSFEAECV